jgi:voltage-gated potassium channel
MLKNIQAFYRIYIALFGFGLVVSGGTIGYMLLENYSFMDALYMTVITVASVGYMEVQPLSESGRIFTIVLIICNIATFTFFITVLSRYFLDGEFLKTYKLLKMENAIAALQGHVIICGYGRNGREAAQVLTRSNKKVVIIERTMTSMQDVRLPEFYLEADATKDETLLQANIHNASAIIITLPDDSENVFIVLTAKELNPTVKIISRASKDSSVKKLKTAGADNVIMPDKIGGSHMASLVLSPDVKEFLDLLHFENTDTFQVTELSIRKSISLKDLDCWNKTGATILGIKKDKQEYILNPTADTELNAGDRLIIMGNAAQIQAANSLV